MIDVSGNTAGGPVPREATSAQARRPVGPRGLGAVRHPRGSTTNLDRAGTGALLDTEGFAAPEPSINAHAASVSADTYSLGQLIGWAVLRQWPQANIPLAPARKSLA